MDLLLRSKWGRAMLKRTLVVVFLGYLSCAMSLVKEEQSVDLKDESVVSTSLKLSGVSRTKENNDDREKGKNKLTNKEKMEQSKKTNEEEKRKELIEKINKRKN